MDPHEWNEAVQQAERKWSRIIGAIPDQEWLYAASGRFPKPRADCTGLAAAARTLSLVGLVVWPLGAVAIGLGLRVVWLSRKRPALGYGRAVSAVTLGCCELVFLAVLIVLHLVNSSPI